MEQTPSLPGRTPELPSVSLSPAERIGETTSTPEIAPHGIGEREQRSIGVSQGESTPPPPAILSIPAPPAHLRSNPVQDDSVSASLPTVANDDDLIEKEWVDKAKKVLAETRDDPYRREQEVNRLQADYLFKRYGRTLGPS